MNESGSSGLFSRSRVTQSFMYAVTPHRSRYSSASSEPASAVVGACRARAARHMPGGILALRARPRALATSFTLHKQQTVSPGIKLRPNEPHTLRTAKHTLSPAARPDEVPWVRPHSRHTYLPQSPPTRCATPALPAHAARPRSMPASPPSRVPSDHLPAGRHTWHTWHIPCHHLARGPAHTAQPRARLTRASVVASPSTACAAPGCRRGRCTWFAACGAGPRG